MDYTSGNSFVTDAGSGNRMHLQAQAIPTAVSDTDMNGLIWEALAVVKAAGIAPVAFDKTVLGSYTQIKQAIKRLAGLNVRTITAAGPTALTADDAGLVVIDASANAVAITLPAVSVVTGAPVLFEFVRADATANTVTISRAGADTFSGGTTSFTLAGQNDYRSIIGDSVSKWLTTSAPTTLQGVPTGAVGYFAGNTAPTGYIKANGAAISRTTYATLFAAIGTTFGVGNGSTTFGVPDLRGEFLRGWDDARGIDSGRAIGTAQLDALQNITGSVATVATNGLSTKSGAFASSVVGAVSSGAVFAAGNYASTVNFDASSIARTAAETRPRNIALLACIKY